MMGEKAKVCLTCLSKGRNLIPLHGIASILEESLITQLKLYTAGICWECQAIMWKFHRFKQRALLAQQILSESFLEYCNLQTLSSLTSKINRNYNNEYAFNFDPLTACSSPKSEPYTIKTEFKDGNDESMENASDLDEKFNTNIENIENIFVDVKESIDETHILASNNTIVKNDTDENHSNIETNKYYKHHVKHKTQKASKKNNNNAKAKRKVVKDTEISEKDIQKKFVEVTLSEEEIVRIREEKRNHPNFKKIPYKCDGCVLGFTRKDTYFLHMNKKHDERIGEYICNICTVRFPNKLSVAKHIRKHFVCYRCRLCRHQTHELWSALNHCKFKHTTDAPNRIHCSQCDVVVKTPEDLEKHTQTQHTLYCNECGVKFKGKGTLRQHKARIHSVKRDFVCDICSKTFITRSRLESHMVRHNAGIARKLAYCQVCNIQYKDIHCYRNHLKSNANHSEKAYSCPDCNKQFASKVYWTKHYNFYHLRKSQYKCEICNKLFISKWRLKNHNQKHHGLSRSRDYPCDVCNKKFYTLAMLRTHQLTHSDQRSYMCEDCGDTFKQSAALYNHTRLVHRGGVKRK